MEVKVHFRFNKATGEIEEFVVDDEGPMRLSEADHNREHDRIAADVGNVIERNPRVIEIVPGMAEQLKVKTVPPLPGTESETAFKTEKDKQSETP